MFRFFYVLLITSMFSSSFLLAFDEKLFKTSLDLKCEEFIKKNNAPGLAVCIVKGSLDLEKPFKKSFYFGDARRYQQISFKDTTTFKLGEVSKSFIACLLLSLAEEGKLSLTDPVNTRLPKFLKVPTSHKTPITLLDLAQHTSGLPSLPLFSIKRTVATAGNIRHFFEQNDGFKKPGTVHKPTDLGYGLLCEALSSPEKKKLNQLLEEKFFGPLGMNSTSIAWDKNIIARLATGYKGVAVADEEKSDRSYSFFYPTIGVISRGDDMVSWLSFLLSVDLTLESIWLKKLYHTSFALTDLSQKKAAFPWLVSSLSVAKPFSTYRLGGSYNGFYSTMAFIPETRTGVFVITNSEYNVTELADQILLLLHD